MFIDCRGGGGNYAAHYQAVTAAQSQVPGGVGSVGYVEVAGHSDLLFDLWGLNKSSAKVLSLSEKDCILRTVCLFKYVKRIANCTNGESLFA